MATCSEELATSSEELTTSSEGVQQKIYDEYNKYNKHKKYNKRPSTTSITSTTSKTSAASITSTTSIPSIASIASKASITSKRSTASITSALGPSTMILPLDLAHRSLYPSAYDYLVARLWFTRALPDDVFTCISEFLGIYGPLLPNTELGWVTGLLE